MRISGDLIKHALIDRDMRQKDLAEKAGITRATISSICGGKRCSEDTARKIAEALGISLGDLIETERKG